jgi:hypothetical protein
MWGLARDGGSKVNLNAADPPSILDIDQLQPRLLAVLSTAYCVYRIQKAYM